MLTKRQSDNGHLWYAVDVEGKIVQVSIFEEHIDKYIQGRGNGADC